MAERSRSWLAESVAILFLVFAVYLLVTNVNPTRKTLVELRRQNGKVDHQIDSLRRELRVLHHEAKGLATDPFAVENALRNRMRITRPGEKIVEFDDRKGSPDAAGTFEKGR